MEKRYIREGNDYYLALRVENSDVKDYQLPMLLQNKISGILPVHMQMLDGEMELYYEITSRKSLAECYDAKKINLSEMIQLILCLSHVSEEIDKYLLKGGGLILEPDCIFWDEEKMKGELCYHPKRDKSVADGLNELTRFILDHIDYEDKESVKLAYTLFQESLQQNISIGDFARLVAEYIPSVEEPEDMVEEGEIQKTDIGALKKQNRTEQMEISNNDVDEEENRYLSQNERKKKMKKQRRERIARFLILALANTAMISLCALAFRIIKMQYILTEWEFAAVEVLLIVFSAFCVIGIEQFINF